MLALGLTALLALAPPLTDAKTRGKGVDVTKSVNALIPDATPVQGSGNPIDGVLISTIKVGKRLKGKRIRDVNVTIQTTAVRGGNPADDLAIFVSAPNRATSLLFRDPGGFGSTAASIGPLTLDDESNKTLGNEPGSNPFELATPFAGTARPAGKPLAVMDNGPVSGTWTLVAIDSRNPPADRLSMLNFWRLRVAAGRPYRSR